MKTSGRTDLSELARQRDAREVWVSRSHLHAALVASLVGVFIAFLMGFYVGQRRVRTVESPQTGFVRGDDAGQDLLKLLYDVEIATVRPDEDLVRTEAQQLGKESVVDVPSAVPEPGIDVAIPKAIGQVENGDYGTVEGPFAVKVLSTPEAEVAKQLARELQAEGRQVSTQLQRVEGAPEYTVWVGGCANKEEAEAAVASLQEAVFALTELSPNVEVVRLTE